MKTRKVSLLVCLSVILALFTVNAQAVLAQDDYQAKRAKAFNLLKQNNFTDALPLLEELAKANSEDAEVLYYAGYLTFTTAQQNTKDIELRKKAGLKARAYLLRSQQLGADNALLRNMLADIAPDGTIDSIKFSNNVEADKILHTAEEAFAGGDFKSALDNYAKALALDPTLYEAALYTGDIYYKSDKPEKASEWFAKAIVIDPNRETAYRYWGDSLAKEGKNKEAREKFIDAYVAEPYDKLAQSGLINWAKANGATLGHPAINIPTDVSSTDGNTKITLDPALLGKDKNDGSSAWFVYGLARASWTAGKNGKPSENFAKAYPNETKYRHSLAEEMDALRMVLTSLDEAIKNKKVKNLDPSLENLKKLNDAGLLEAYVLMAKLDNGLFQDYKSYLNTNRDKLRRYVNEFVISGRK